VDYTGRIVFHWRGPGEEGQNVRNLAQPDVSGALEALAPGTLSEFQKLQLLAVSAMRREGEHNDVFRHVVWPVADRGGNPTAMVVLAFDVNPQVSRPPGLVGAISLSLLLPVWCYEAGNCYGARD